MRLAKDCELLDTWSSGTDLFLCVDRLVVGPTSGARVTEDRNEAYDVWAFVGEEGQATPLVVVVVVVPVVVSEAEEVSLVCVRGIAFRTPVLLLVGWVACWSNLFFRSFTLGLWPLALVEATDLDLELVEGGGLVSSIGADNDRAEGRRPVRVDEEIVGCFGVVPFPFDRREALWVCLGVGIADDAIRPVPVCGNGATAVSDVSVPR